MSGITSASFLARRAAQRERVRILYRRALRDTLNWAVHRHLFYPDADALRERFEANRKVEDIETIDRLIADGEASYNKWRHPDPYIGPKVSGFGLVARAQLVMCELGAHHRLKPGILT
ncbi:NADH dehydrogenase [ubiquinone] 1 beta subcomplex subunit 9 [Capsicum annuum]|nr:NADH dehydrogenase [ubiquinone] 1 beta subcomplex subunit 9 [Capsicum annuum]